jgi:hypothetical protein
MVLKDVIDTSSDISDLINTHFLLNDYSDFIIYWNPDKPPEYSNQEIYLCVHEKRNGELIKKYFSTDTKLEELDVAFSNDISSVLINEM